MSSEIRNSVAEGVKEAVDNISATGANAILEVRHRLPKKGLLDHLQEKIVSRKLLVFITATILMWFGLNPETWGMIAMCYIGGQSAIDMVKAYRWG